MGSDVIPSPLEEDWNRPWVLTGGRGRGQGRAGPGPELREWGLIFHCLHLCVIFFYNVYL